MNLMIVKKMYQNFLKILISNLFFILFIFNQNAVSKPIPPGSGEGDVPANILILLDSSASMHRLLTSGEAIDIPGDIVEDEDGNIIHRGISQRFFSKSFTIATDVEVKGAELKDGLLTVALERIIPEAKKAKTIEIK